MYRGTNPIIRLQVELDTSLIEDVYVTFSQDNVNIEKTFEDCTISEGVIAVNLTQDETLSLKVGIVQVQARIKLSDETLLATEIFNIPVQKILKEGVI